MIHATVQQTNAAPFDHKFHTNDVKSVYVAMQRHLGKCIGTSYRDNKLFWEFQHGRVLLTGDVIIKHGYRRMK